MRLHACASTLAQHVRVGTFVVVRNVAPIITLFAEAALHPESAPRADLYTVGALGCIALGILFYEMHDLGGSPLGLQGSRCLSFHATLRVARTLRASSSRKVSTE